MNAEQQKSFDEFWNNHWPKCRRKDKKKAMDQWARIAPVLYETIYAAVDRQKKQPSWNKDDCAFIPHPFRWLRDQRWEDEITLPEDKDADILIEALTNNSSVPHDFPKHIMDRCRRLCERSRTNWPLLHHQLNKDEATAKKIRADYLATA